MAELNHNTERRQHFRINESAILEFRTVPQDSAPLAELFPPSPHFQLQTELRELDEEAESLLRRINEDDKAIAGYLRMLNRKIDRLAQCIGQAPENPPPAPISLSEGGLSFSHHQPLIQGQRLALKLQLLPENAGLLAFADVRYSLLQDDGAYRIGCQFFELDDRNRHLIARHLMEAQARQRRRQRQQDPQH